MMPLTLIPVTCLAMVPSFRKVTWTPDPDTCEKYRDTSLISIARCSRKSMRSRWQKVLYFTIRLPFVRDSCGEALGLRVVWALLSSYTLRCAAWRLYKPRGGTRPESCPSRVESLDFWSPKFHRRKIHLQKSTQYKKVHLNKFLRAISIGLLLASQGRTQTFAWTCQVRVNAVFLWYSGILSVFLGL